MEALVGRETELRRLRLVLDEDGPHAVVVVGAAGVGKSRLLQEVAGLVDDRLWLVLRVFGSPPLMSIPLGAVSHLVRHGSSENPSQLFHAAVARIRQEALRRRVLLLVDDSHCLDEGSTGLVQQLVSHGVARTILTQRLDASASEVTASLWASGAGDRLELAPLDRDNEERLAEAVLGGAVEPPLLDELHRVTLGNPLYLLNCLRAARSNGSVQMKGGVWRLTGTLISSRLSELVLSRTHELSGKARHALASLAVGGSLPMAVFKSLVDALDLQVLVDRGLVTVTDDTETATVDVAHPVYAETIAASLTVEERRRVLVELAESVLAEGEGGPAASLRAAMWLLEAFHPIGDDLATEAAREAMLRLDYELSERLAGIAVRARPGSVKASLLLARAMAFQGRAQEALSLLQALDPSTEEELAEIALAQGHILAFVQGRPDEAVALLNSAVSKVGGPLRARLDAERALYRATVGDFRAVVDVADDVLGNPDASDLAVLATYVNYSLARAMTAMLDGFEEMMDQAMTLAQRHAPDMPLAIHQLGLARVAAWAADGRLAAAEGFAGDQAAEADAGGTPNPLWLAWLGYTCGLRGDLDRAIEAQTRALALFEIADPFRLWPQSMGLLTMHQAQAARLPADADESLAAAERLAGAETRLTIWIGRARAWMAALARDSRIAAEVAAEVGTAAVEHDHVAWGIEALHDAVRFGHPTVVHDVLAAAVGGTSGTRLGEAMLQHAVALGDGEPSATGEAADALARCGSPLLGAEAWAQAARLHVRRKEPQLAGRATLLSQLWHARCAAAATPALADRPHGFTARQLEVIEQAAAGLSSREIADRMFLSPRTVDNHLHRVYRRLGVSGREELAALVTIDTS